MYYTPSVLQGFLDRLKKLSFFERLFSWGRIKTELIDATAAYSNLLSELEHLRSAQAKISQELSDCKKDLHISNEQNARFEAAQRRYEEVSADKEARIAELSKQLATATTHCSNLEKQVQTQSGELAAINERLLHLDQKLKEATKECIEWRQKEESRKTEHAKAMDTFTKWREQLQADRNREIEEKQQAEIDRLKKLKQTWSQHEQDVKTKIKALCQKLTIEYADSVPFKGTPDNAIKLANEYIVFDAKSPAGDDLNNFPLYLKDQAEKAKKYARQEGVKKDIFFVVPSNTLEVIRQTVFSLGDFDVYVVSVDVLEPLLLCLQKIETYEFAEQLTPEERENICRIIGRFTHLTKRRIQIDSFFARQFMEMVLKCDSDLPEEIKKEVAQFEKAEKLNPPSDRRTKAIDNKQLQSDMLQLEIKIGSKGIVTDDLSEELNRVRLYKEQ